MNNADDIKKSILFPKSAEEIGSRLQRISQNEILTEEHELVEDYPEIEHIFIAEERLQPLFSTNTEVSDTIPAPQPDQFGFDYKLLHEAALYRSREQLAGEIKPDKLIIHGINTITELTQTSNLLSERLHEWYGLHWPEFSRQVSETEYLNLILEHGTREDILADKSEKEIPDRQNDVIGGSLSTADMDAIRGLAKVLKEIHIEREQLERYVRECVEELAPNTSKVAGALITAKLIAYTNGISRLARVSASTIQLLGAEKALFRHLKDGSSPPKHGVIFQHPLLHSSPYWQRGKIARALATKIAIAIKIDHYQGSYQGDRLESELQTRIKEIQMKFPKAPSSSKKGKPKSKSTKPKRRQKQTGAKGKRAKKR